MKLSQRLLSPLIDFIYIIGGLAPACLTGRCYEVLNRWYYRFRAPFYDEQINSALDYSEALEAGLQEIRSAPQRILDVNTGTGFVALKLHELFPSASIVATDLSEAMLAQARANAHGVPIQFVRADVAHLPFANESFDLVTLHNGPPHTAEMMRVLRSKGQMLIAFSAGARVFRPARRRFLQELEDLGKIKHAETDRGWWVLVTRTTRDA